MYDTYAVSAHKVGMSIFSTPRVIGIGGHLRAGKDTLANLLAQQLPNVVVIGFSDALSHALEVLNPVIDNGWEGEIRYATALQLYGYTETKRRFPEARALLQRLGTDVGRNLIDENIWVRITEQRIHDLLESGHTVIVTGVRFGNELEMIVSVGGTTVWVERPEVHATSGHISERAVSAEDFDLVVVNDGTVEDLRRRASTALDPRAAA